MRVKDPSLRSCYSHPLLSEIESDIDDHRDAKGHTISSDEFRSIVAKYQERATGESELLYELAHENFIDDEDDAGDQADDGDDGDEQFEGCDERDFPPYRTILDRLGSVSDEMWEAYDKETHQLCRALCCNITDRERVTELGTQVVVHQVSFDEETSVCLHTILFVLKTIVPYRSNSKYQNSVKRAETWLQQALLM